MKKTFSFISLFFIITSCSNTIERIDYQTNDYCSEKKTLSIATEALDNMIDGNFKIKYIEVKKDMIYPKSCLKFMNPSMSNTYYDYFVKEKFRNGQKKEARIRISSKNAELKKMPEKHIGYMMLISGEAFDDNITKKFTATLHLDLDLIAYNNGDDWDHFRALNVISKDSILYYLNNREIDSALIRQYSENNDISIYFYE